MTTETSRTVDLLVLGATVAGLTTAVCAAEAGASVLVVDPNEISRFGTGLLTVALGGTLREVETHRGIAACETLISEAVRGIDWLTGTLEAADVATTARTAYSLAVDGHLAFHLRQEARLLRRGGLEVDFTDAQPLAPLVTRPALVLADQAQIDPHQHREALTTVARERGVDVVTGAALGRFVPGQPWRVTYETTEAQVSVNAPSVVDTVGSAPWGGPWGASLKVTPVVLAKASESPVPSEIHVLVDTPAALLFSQHGHAVMVGHPVSPTDEHAATVDLVAFASRLGLDVTAVRHRHIERTPDRLPMAGAVPLLEGAWTARGFGLAETTLATAAGLQLAEAVTGQRDDMPWAPWRAPAPLALYRRWNGQNSDPMVGVPGILKRRGLA